MEKGLFITIYGINNIGKTTHAKLLCENLTKKGYKTKYLKYPVYDVKPSGEYLNKILRNPNGQKITEQELQLWFVLNRYQFQPKLQKLLADGYIVVAEDYTATGIAWGIAKGLDEEWITTVNQNLLKEDLAIMLTGNRDIRAKEKVHVHEQNDELVNKCKEVHDYLAEKYKWHIVSLQEKVSDTADIILNIVDDYLKEIYS